MAKLNITPVWNLPYAPEYNSAIERYWGQLKAYFRPLLLQKMVKDPRSKDQPLKDSVRQAIRDVSTASIPAFCKAGLEALNRDAAEIRFERKILGISNLASDGSPRK